MRRASAIIAVMLALGALSGVGAFQLVPPATQGAADWREIAWPFPRDGWPAGRAFRCESGACDGAELYIRAKLGFCNCERGVADDDEVDRVTDLDLISPRFAATAPGGEIQVGDLHGRARRYNLDMPDGSRHAASGIAVSRRCDLLVAVAQGAGAPMGVQRAALAFLERQEMKAWMLAALDGR
jgi:hypothetical protein